MKKIFAAICFLACMFSAWASAEEPGKYPADIVEKQEGGLTPPHAGEEGIRLADRELFLVKGRAIKTGMPHVPETDGRGIVLWDEGSGNTDGAIHKGSGQSMITIHR